MKDDFLNLIHVPGAVRLLLDNLATGPGGSERVGLEEASGRVSAEDIASPADLPGFLRSSMDGFAVRANDTFGASESLPAYLELAGEVPMGTLPEVAVTSGKAARISTGGALPEGADAVVMVENTELAGTTVEVVRAVAPGENTIEPDEDVSAGDVIVRRGDVLGPSLLGALAGAGVLEVPVFQPPRAAVVSTGDEVVPAAEVPRPGQVRDINSVALAAAVREAGGVPVFYGIVGDEPGRLLEVARGALEECDILLISGGSSAGVRDVTLEVLESLGEPGLLAHGIYLKPGKPTLVAVCGGKPALGLPGNPASALAVFRELVAPVLAALKGEAPRPWDLAPRTLSARMDRSVSSPAGRVELVAVSLSEERGGLAASPVPGKANLIGTLIRADGQVRIPLGSEGVEQGQVVTVELFE